MKRSFDEIRNKILNGLSKSSMTKIEIANNINADYRTVEKHLIWLLGTDKVKKMKKNKKVYYKFK